MSPDEAREVMDDWHRGEAVDWDDSRRGLETLAALDSRYAAQTTRHEDGSGGWVIRFEAGTEEECWEFLRKDQSVAGHTPDTRRVAFRAESPDWTPL